MTEWAMIDPATRQALIFNRVFQGGNEEDLASLFHGEYLTDAVLNAAGQHILRIRGREDGDFFIPIEAIPLFHHLQNMDALPVIFNTENGRMFTIQHHNRHWILHHIDFEQRRMDVADSLRGTIPLDEIRTFQNDLARMFSYRYQIPIQEWTLHQPDANLPQQQNGFSCGDFALEFLRRILGAQNGNVFNVDPSTISNARPRIANVLMQNDLNGVQLLANQDNNPQTIQNILLLLHRRSRYRQDVAHRDRILRELGQARATHKDVEPLQMKILELETSLRNQRTNGVELPEGSYYISALP